MDACGIILWDRLGRYCPISTVKPVLLVLAIGGFIFLLVLASILSFVAELVLLRIFQLLVELICLSLCFLAL